MKTFLKIISGLLAIIIIAIAAFVFTFDPNDYKAQLTQAVEQQTGRTLSIEGDISLSLFPWIGLEVGKLTLSNAQGFSKNDFARIDQLDIKVKVLPLLKRDIVVHKIRLHGLSASLETHKDGKTNWQDLAQSADTGDTEIKDEKETSGQPALAGLLVNGIELVGANIQWIDDQSGTHAAISDLNLETGNIQFDTWVPLTFSAHVNNNKPEVDARIKLDTKLKFNRELTVFDISDFDLGVNALMKSIAAERIDVRLQTAAHADLQQQKASLDKLKLSAFGAELMADLAITGLDSTPTATGTVATNEMNPRVLAKKFGIELPVSANSSRLGVATLTARIDANASRAKLSDIQLRLDESTLKGVVNIPDIAKQSVRYQLTLDRIDVDSYLPPVVDEPAAVPPVTPVADEDIEIALPVEMMRTLDIDGELKVAAMRVKAIDITDVQLVTKADKGVITVSPINMKMLQGTLNAQAVVDVRKDTRYQFKLITAEMLPGPLINPLLVGILGYQDISIAGGTAAVNVDVKSAGQWLSELKRSATGDLRLDVNKTVVSGVDIDYFTRNSVGDFLAARNINVSSDWRGSYKPKQKTAFDSIVATAIISGGQVVNDKLAINSSRIKVNGDGVIDIMKNSIDEKLLVELNMERQQNIEDKVLAKPVPVHIHGPFEQLKFEVDKTRLAKVITDLIRVETGAKAAEFKAAADAKAAAARAAADAKAAAAKAEAQQKLDAQKAELKAREAEKAEQMKQEAEDKVKNKLKGLFN